jgi:hypothetical protein
MHYAISAQVLSLKHGTIGAGDCDINDLPLVAQGRINANNYTNKSGLSMGRYCNHFADLISDSYGTGHGLSPLRYNE